jgi:hypothetical protein
VLGFHRSPYFCAWLKPAFIANYLIEESQAVDLRQLWVGGSSKFCFYSGLNLVAVWILSKRLLLYMNFLIYFCRKRQLKYHI